MRKMNLLLTMTMIVSLACLSCAKKVQPSSGADAEQTEQTATQDKTTMDKETSSDEQASSDSEGLLNVEPLLDDYDHLLNEFCELSPCFFSDYMSGEPGPSKEECLQEMREEETPAIPSCPLIEKVDMAIAMKCRLDLYKELGNDVCEFGPTRTMFNFKVHDCQFGGYDVSKYQICMCQHIDELPDADEETKNGCQKLLEVIKQ